MIIVKIIGGLGNQLFQYATARALALRTNQELAFDVEEYHKENVGDTKRKLELHLMGISATQVGRKDLKRVKGREPCSRRYLSRLDRIFYKRPRTYIKEIGPEAIDKLLHLQSEAYLFGYWQSEEYFKDFAKQIRSDLHFSETMNEANVSLLKEISLSNSVGLHVRRGDYANDEKTNVYHGMCSLDYYREALRLISEKCGKPDIFVFSDDINLCRQNLTSTETMHFVTQNEAENTVMDMELMSACKHNIVANSSFSWWGAWLNANEDKMVIAPKKWFNVVDPFKSFRTPAKWVRL
jgi:hypothetical protein